MPRLDPFLTALVSHEADALLLSANDVARLDIGGVPRPVTKQSFTHAQVMALLVEVAGPDDRRAMEAGRETSWVHRSDDRDFMIRVTPTGDGIEVAIRESTADTTPAEPASPVPPPARTEIRVEADSVRAESAERADLEILLTTMMERGASDLHLRVGEPPIIRQHGEMHRLTDREPVRNETLEAMLHAIMPDRNRDEYAERNDSDFAYEIPGVARFRVNGLRDHHGAGAVFRLIPARVVTVDELGISEEVQRLCFLTRGLVLVTGPTGSGKSTTLCSLVDLCNRNRHDHVITIEDPIEFVHENKKCIITQRQVGVHTSSFKHALRAALREDPDIVLVGELRDLETVSTAIETAETGHLVFGTLHTTSAASTVDRLIDQFPPDRQEQIRVMLSESLKGVISQTLCKKIGGGRVAAREILLMTPSTANLIREGKTFQIPSVIQTGRKLGMVTLNDALIELVDAEQVEPREAFYKANDKTGFAAMLKQRGHDVSFLDALDTAAPSSNGSTPGGKAESGGKHRAGARS